MKKVIRFPLVRIIIAVLLVGIGLILGQTLLNLGRAALSIKQIELANLAALILITPLTYFPYWIFVHFAERRDLTELAREKRDREFGLGSLIGFGLFSLVIGILWLLGYYRVTGVSFLGLLLIGGLAGALVSAFVQELIFRAIIYRIAEEWLGTWWAVGISALLFGLIHLTSAGATLFSALAVALQAGVLLAAAYALTHRLWMALGIHMAWDFANDGIFGVGVAGQTGQLIPGLFQAKLSGPELFTGGALGVEGSLITLVVMLVASFILLGRVKQKREWDSRQNQTWLTERLGKTS